MILEKIAIAIKEKQYNLINSENNQPLSVEWLINTDSIIIDKIYDNYIHVIFHNHYCYTMESLNSFLSCLKKDIVFEDVVFIVTIYV